MRRFVWTLLLSAFVGLIPEALAAQAEVCQLTGFASLDGFDLACAPALSCDSDPDCAGGVLPTSCDTVSNLCLPECGTLVSCRADEDCVDLDPGARCVRIGPGGSLPYPGVCEVPTVPVVYCETATGLTSAPAVLACHTLPFSDTLTPSWFDGDCDRDGCPNNNDTLPCEINRACAEPFWPERTCPRRLIGSGPERCTIVRSSGVMEVSCATAHACDGEPGACPVGFACEGGLCQPTVCGTLYGCRADSDCEGTPLGNGSCVEAPDVFGVNRGGDGFCTFTSFRTDALCLGMVSACLETPSGAPTLDFFQGDCDEDGCPNGSDDSVCAPGYAACTPATSIACGVPLEVPMEEEDASMGPDAGGLDAGTARIDAAPFDAPVEPPVSFAGGGGFRCGVGHGSRGALVPLLFALLGLVLVRRRA